LEKNEARKPAFLPVLLVPLRPPRAPASQPNDGTEQVEPCDALAEAEALRGQLQAALTRTARLIAALKQRRWESRAVKAAMASLRRLQS
jgi:hypothetical protein